MKGSFKMSSDLEKKMNKYEYVTRNYLTCRTTVIVRVDGRAFHTFTRGSVKPFDPILVKTMHETMQYLCEHIEGCVMGYTQSDEITLVLCDYQTLTSQAWFDNNIQKICSIVASMATLMFNRYFERNVRAWTFEMEETLDKDSDEFTRFCEVSEKYSRSMMNGAIFDSRAFNIPKEEVNNCLLWRQQDAIRNSIEATGQAYFSHNELHKKSINVIKDMLKEKGVDWDAFPAELRMGSCCVKKEQVYRRYNGEPFTRKKWCLDNYVPKFDKDTDYVNSRIMLG